MKGILKGIAAISVSAFLISAPLTHWVGATSLPRSSRVGPRIVGGENVKPEQNPWVVSLQVQQEGASMHICGGTLVAPIYVEHDGEHEVAGWSNHAEDARWVLTAAHCVTDSTGEKDANASYRVVSGTNDLASRGSEVIEQEVELIIVHQQYDPITNQNDLALLRLTELEPGQRANIGRRPIALPGVNASVWVNKPYTELIVSGWGRTSEGGYASQILKEVALPLVDQGYCQSVYNAFGNEITSDMLCAGFQTGGKDSCQGDSGGPLHYRPRSVPNQPTDRPILVGVVSWGIGCARGGGLFGIYSRVAANLEWIEGAVAANR